MDFESLRKVVCICAGSFAFSAAAQTAAVPSPGGAEAMRAAIDPKTGQLRPVENDEGRAISAQTESLRAARAGSEKRVVRSQAGAVGVRIDGAALNSMRADVGADGRLVTFHGEAGEVRDVK